jgi:nicotinamide-nucleotide amidase
MPLVEDEDSLERIRVFFESRGREMKDNNRKQALIPQGSTVLVNDNGTAPGIYIKKGRQVIIMLPGPPHELMPMFTEKAVPLLRELADTRIFNKTVCVCGIGESELETMIKDRLYGENPHAALYAKEGEVEISVTSYGDTDEEAETRAEDYIQGLRNVLGNSIYSEDGETIAETAVRLLVEKKQTVAVAESCTGGMVAQMITDVPGSSAVFEYGITSYGDWVKNASLGVDNSLLKKYTAISSAVGAEMARGARKNGMATYGIGITGIAGPGVGSYLDKEVGQVYIAVCNKKKTIVKEFRFGDKRSRDNIRRLSAKNAFDMLRRFIEGKPIEGGTEFSNRKIADLDRKDNPRSIAGLFARKVISIICAGGVALTAGYFGIRTVQAYSERLTYDKLTASYAERIASEDGKQSAFEELNGENPDFCGWISNSECELDTVVVEGRDDGYYLTHDFFKGSSRLGCAAVTAGLPLEEIPVNLSVEGSTGGKGVVFNALEKYRDIEYAKKNNILVFYGENFTARYQVISAMLLDSAEELDDIYYSGDLSSKDDYYSYILNLKMRSFYDVNYKLTENERFITLYADTEDWEGSMIVVCGVLLDEDDSTNYVMTENDVVLYPQTWYTMKGTQSGVNLTAEADRWYEWIASNTQEENQE